MSERATARGGGIRKMIIVLLLVGGVMLLHRFAVRPEGLDPSALLALGFVILASYAFGQLVEQVGLPHITGYLIAGLLLGPSIASMLPQILPAGWAVAPPFDEGVLSESVQEQLQPLNTLAVALIALTAGSELKLESLRKGLATILGVLGGQVVVIPIACVGFLLALSFLGDTVSVPGLGALGTTDAIWLGAILGSISLATSPAATIAVINDVRARGPLTSTLLATVVLKDVVVVVLFSVVSTFAVTALGLSEGPQGALGLYLLKHIGGALAIGVAVGFAMALYLKYVKAEPLLFLVATVYTAAFLASELDVEVVVLFIAAGFAAANFSSEGENLLESVVKLSLPVYVVFFTLAGAHLPLESLIGLLPFAIALVVLRTGAIWAGTALGGRLFGAPAPVKRFGWLGFVSQAGVAISLASIVGRRMGEQGETLSTLIIAGIALNELAGPILLKLGLSASGETGASDEDDEAEESVVSEPSDREEPTPGPVEPWPAPSEVTRDFSPEVHLASAELNEQIHDLALDLAHVSHDVADEPLRRFREGALEYVRELRREFLRHHRRISVQASDTKSEHGAAAALRLEQAELAEKWRTAVLARAAKLRAPPDWEPAPIVAAVDALTEGLPERVPAPYEAISFEPREGDSIARSIARTWLRTRRAVRSFVGLRMPPRIVELRALSRYHLWGRLPERLEPVATLYALAEMHFVDRTRSIFDGIVLEYDGLAKRIESSRREGAEPLDVEGLLREIRVHVDEELVLAVQEVDRIRDDLASRTRSALRACLKDLEEDLPHAGGPDLSMRKRAASSLYASRNEAMERLESGTRGTRRTCAALFNRLALEMELHALEGRVKDTLEDLAADLGADVRGRAFRQVERVCEAIDAAETQLDAALQPGQGAHAVAEQVRAICDPLVRISAEAARAASLLRDQLLDEASVTPVLDSLTRAAHGLTQRYEVPAGPIARGEHRLPPPVATLEVPFRDWVLARIETAIAPRLLASTRAVAQKVEPLSASLSEMERRVAFNAELAVGELIVIDDDHVTPDTLRLVREMTFGALERNRELFASYGRESATWNDEVREAVSRSVLQSLDELRGGLVDGEVGRMRSQMVRDVRGRRAVRVLRELRTAISRSWVVLRRALIEAVGTARVERVRTALGLGLSELDEEDRALRFDPPESRSAIPMVYRRLFSASALEAGDILTDRDEALRRAMALLDGNGSGLRTVAVVGPDGVGKSAFVSAVQRAKRWTKVRVFDPREPATVEQVEAMFDRHVEGQLVVVIGVRWLRSLTPGGFAPLRRFVELVVEDAGKNAFLVQADRLVWEGCRQGAALDHAFPEVVDLAPLSADALQAAVLARHAVSGFGLVFSHGIQPESRIEEVLMRATAPISRPRQTFFRALHAASGGVLRDALRLWLASVEEVDEAGDFVHLGPVPPPTIYALRRLGADDVFTLYQVARQGWMSANVCASLFRVSLASAQARLAALAHVGLLEQRERMYLIAPHLQGSVTRLLEERGFVR
ncbi:MAG: cation:proton antiporter [Sandaracinaceae bacterium]